MTTAYIALGSNLGDRENYITQAVTLLGQAESIRLCRVSSVIETEALSDKKQPSYLNAVAEIETTLSPQDLLRETKAIEASLGRVRSGQRYQSRTIDIDILLFGQEIIKTADLIVPHSRMHLRTFVLTGMCELDGEFVHPVLKDSMLELAGRLGGGNFAVVPDAVQLISIAGIIGAGKTTLAQAVSKRLGCKLIKEEYDTNPFLADVYAGKNELALDSEIFFLMSRADQLSKKTLNPSMPVVSDYVVEKELIYAKNWLDSQQMALYKKVNRTANANLVQPVLVIYLQTPPAECMNRIHSRQRPYEQEIELDSGGQNILILRSREEVELYALSGGSEIFIAALLEGQTLEQASTAAAQNPGFELSASLAMLINSGAFSGFDNNNNKGINQ